MDYEDKAIIFVSTTFLLAQHFLLLTLLDPLYVRHSCVGQYAFEGEYSMDRMFAFLCIPVL